MIRNVNWSSRKILEKYSNTKFHENPFSGSRDAPCEQMYGLMDGKTRQAYNCFFETLRKRLSARPSQRRIAAMPRVDVQFPSSGGPPSCFLTITILCCFCWSCDTVKDGVQRCAYFRVKDHMSSWRNVLLVALLQTLKIMINLLKPTGHVMLQQFNIQQLYVLPTLYLCVLYLSENKQRIVPLTA